MSPWLLSVTASVPGTSMQNVACVINGVTLTRSRYYHWQVVDFRWGLAG